MPAKRKAAATSDETLSLFEPAEKSAGPKRTTRPFGAADLRVGTSAFTAAGWEDAFYPAGMKPSDYLTYYATQLNAVEIDSTLYRLSPMPFGRSVRDRIPFSLGVAM
jgi:hypothetical protein